jgi:hypothetical protein
MEDHVQSESLEDFSTKPKLSKTIIAFAVLAIVIIPVVLFVTLSGKSNVAGKYYASVGSPASPMLELKTDGTFYMEAYGIEQMSGVYEISGNKITIWPEGLSISSEDFFIEGTIKGNTITGLAEDDFVKD